MRKPWTLSLTTCAAALFATLAVGQVSCSFDSECFEDDACSDAAFLFEYEDLAGGARLQQGVTATTEFGTFGGYTLKRFETGAHYMFEGASTMYFLSVEAGQARLSVHMEGPMVVTYLGQCE